MDIRVQPGRAGRIYIAGLPCGSPRRQGSRAHPGEQGGGGGREGRDGFSFVAWGWTGEHAIHRQHVHQRLSPQVTVPERVCQSGQIRTGCCTFPLYHSAWPIRLPMRTLTSHNLQELYRGASWYGSSHS